MQINWQNLLNALGSRVTQPSPNVKQPCPLHPHTEPTLNVDVDSNPTIPAFRCDNPSCWFTGDAFALIATAGKVELSEAVELVRLHTVDGCDLDDTPDTWAADYLSVQNTAVRTSAYIDRCRSLFRQTPEMYKFKIGLNQGNIQFLPAEIGLLCKDDLPKAFKEFGRTKYQNSQYFVYPYAYNGQYTHVRIQNTEDGVLSTVPVGLLNPGSGVYPESNLKGLHTDLFVTLNPRLASIIHSEFAVESDRYPPVIAAAGFPLPEAASTVRTIHLLSLTDAPLTLDDTFKIFAATQLVANATVQPKIFVFQSPLLTAETITSEALLRVTTTLIPEYRVGLAAWIIRELEHYFRSGHIETICHAISESGITAEKRDELVAKASTMRIDAALVELIRTTGLSTSGRYVLGNGTVFIRTAEGLRVISDTPQGLPLSNFDIAVDRKIRTKSGADSFVCVIIPQDKKASPVTLRLDPPMLTQKSTIQQAIMRAYAEKEESPYIACYNLRSAEWPDVINKLAEGCEVYPEVDTLGVSGTGVIHFPCTTLRLATQTLEPQQQAFKLPVPVTAMYGGLKPVVSVEYKEPYRRLFQHSDNLFIAGFVGGLCHVIHRLTSALYAPSDAGLKEQRHLLFVNVEQGFWDPVFRQLAYLFSGHENYPRIHSKSPAAKLKAYAVLGQLPWIGEIPGLPHPELRRAIDDTDINIMGLVEVATARSFDTADNVSFAACPRADMDTEVTVLAQADLEELRRCLPSFLLDMAVRLVGDAAYRCSHEPALTTYTVLCELLGVEASATMSTIVKCYFNTAANGVLDFFQALHMVYDGSMARHVKLKLDFCDDTAKLYLNTKDANVIVCREVVIIRQKLASEINMAQPEHFYATGLTRELSDRNLLVPIPEAMGLRRDRYWAISRDTWEHQIVRTPIRLAPVQSAQPIRPFSINVA